MVVRPALLWGTHGSRWIGVAIIEPPTVVAEGSDCVHGSECSPACYPAVRGVASRDVSMPGCDHRLGGAR